MVKNNGKRSEKSRKKVLVVDDDEALARLIKTDLEQDGFEVITALDGVSAQNLLGHEKFDAILSEIHIPGRLSGFELFRFARDAEKTPFILMTAFATAAKRKEAADIGVNGFLSKPFRREELLQKLKEVCGFSPEIADAEPDLDENYAKVRIDDFISGRRVQYSIFIRLSRSKYVKIANVGEDLPTSQIQAYKDRGIRHLHLMKADFSKYMNFNLGFAHAVKNCRSLSNEKKARLIKHTGEVILEQIFTSDIDQGLFEDARNVVETAVAFLAGAPDTFDLLSALCEHSDALYAHSLGVSVFSSMIAKLVDWSSPQTIYKISIAGLLHDIGMKEIDRTVCEKPRGDMTRDEVRLFETHSFRGVEILSGVPSVASEVMQIILHHHERDLGTGYPGHLTKNKIHPMARLIAVADEFCKLTIKGPSCTGLAPREALQRMHALFGGTLDGAFLQSLMTVFDMPAQGHSR